MDCFLGSAIAGSRQTSMCFFEAGSEWQKSCDEVHVAVRSERALLDKLCRQKDRRVHFSAAQPFAEAEAGKR